MQPGLAFCSTFVLRTGIVLVGFKVYLYIYIYIYKREREKERLHNKKIT